MTTIQRILVPVDFSETSRAALERAVSLAEQVGAEVEVLHVWEPPGFTQPTMMLLSDTEPARTLEEHVRLRAAEETGKLIATLTSRNLSRLHGRLEIGDPAELILRIARDEQFSLIVMGTHGRRGLSRLLLGSVTQDVFRRAPCPVMTVTTAEKAPLRVEAPGTVTEGPPPVTA